MFISGRWMDRKTFENVSIETICTNLYEISKIKKILFPSIFILAAD